MEHQEELLVVDVDNHAGIGQECRRCIHAMKKEFRGTRSGWYYCLERSSIRTDCGYERVKAHRGGCRKWELNSEEPWKKQRAGESKGE